MGGKGIANIGEIWRRDHCRAQEMGQAAALRLIADPYIYGVLLCRAQMRRHLGRLLASGAQFERLRGEMTQTSNRLLDEFAKLMTDMAGVAQGIRREVETAVKSQVERFLGEMDVVQREEFEAAREMAIQAREENEALKARIEALEARLGAANGGAEPPVKRGARKRSGAAGLEGSEH
jgi:BMFP domain-containing protein YqiC